MSVVIPCARGVPRQLLDDLGGQLSDADELLLVRNRARGSRSRWVGLADASSNARAPEAAPPGCIVLLSSAGAAEARNLGWRRARHRWIVFLDDDVSVRPNFVAEVRAAAAAAVSTGVMTFRVASRAQGTSGLVAFTTSLDRGSATQSTEGTPMDLPDAWRFGVGAAMLARREVLEETSGFKALLGAGLRNGGAEDLEFIWHASRHATVTYRGEIVVEHDDPPTAREIGRKLCHYGRAIGALSASIGGRQGAQTVTDYCGHLWRAGLRLSQVERSVLADRGRFRLQIAAAYVETLRVFFVSRIRRGRGRPSDSCCHA